MILKFGVQRQSVGGSAVSFLQHVRMKKELYLKRGLRHGNKALENIINQEIIQSNNLNGINKEIKRLKKANDYLSKAFEHEANNNTITDITIL